MRAHETKNNKTLELFDELKKIETAAQKIDEEAFEELEELLEEDDCIQQTENEDSLTRTVKKSKSNKIFKSAYALLSNSNLPSLFLNKDLLILNASPALYRLFEGYYTIENKPFFNIFKNLFTKDELEAFFKSLKSPEKGFSYVGILTHKTKYKKMLYTKINIFPLFTADTVNGYWVVFDNITNNFIEQYKNIIQGFLNASKLKDNDTGYHNERLNYYSAALAQALFEENTFPQIDAGFIDDISILAATHDIGKIGTPDYILQKKGKLTPTEWKIMREHTISGALILSTYPSPMAKEIALSHHERWDGTGYPYNLTGEMIPLSARIVTIADVYDALRMRRSYKESIPHEESVKYIAEGAGKQFDPAIIEVFKKIADTFNTIWERFKDIPQSDNPEETILSLEL